jgi:D-threo-aldose 1-dehydrogenase
MLRSTDCLIIIYLSSLHCTMNHKFKMSKSKFITLSRPRPLGPRNLILGCAPLASLYSSVDPRDASETLRLSIQLGWGGFDTAPSYGSGESERRIGNFLSQMKEQNLPQVNVWTKVGRVLTTGQVDPMLEIDSQSPGIFASNPGTETKLVFDYSEQGIYQSLRDSEHRLQYPIHGLRLHDAETEHRYQDVIKHRSIDTMIGLKLRGKVRSIGLGMNDPQYILRILGSYPERTFDNIMMAGSWNLMDQSGLDVLIQCHESGIPLINCGIFGSGLLWGGDMLRYSKVSKKDIKRLRAWESLGKKYNLRLPVIALAFAFLPQCVESVCIGARTPGELMENHCLLSEIQMVPVDLWLDAIDQKLLPGYLTKWINGEMDRISVSKL